MPSHRRPTRRSKTLRNAAFATAVLGGVFLPTTAAFAADGPAPRAAAPSTDQAPSAKAADPQKAAPAAQEKTPSTAAPAPVKPRGGAAAGERPAPAPDSAKSAAAPAPEVKKPSGGVAAGERPAAETGDDATATVAGSAAGAALLAGAGAFALRRRAAARHNG